MTILLKQFLSILSLSFLMASCSTSMRVSDNLETDTSVMEVKGRSGGMPSQKIVFGDYVSSKVERKIAATQADTYAVSSQTTKDTLQFNVFNPAGDSSRVFCLSKKSELSLPVAGEKFQVPVGSQDVCVGTIILGAAGPGWNFTIDNPNAIASDFISEGKISNGQTTIEFKAVQHNAKGKLMKDRMLGFEFWQGGDAVGAVELMGSGRIFIKNTLPEDLKFLIATTAATMLLRYDMSKAKEM